MKPDSVHRDHKSLHPLETKYKNIGISKPVSKFCQANKHLIENADI